MPTIAAPLVLTDDDRRRLEQMARSSRLPRRAVTQAKALLWAEQGVANEEIARRCHVDSDAVRGWRKRFADERVDGVGKIAEGRGRKSWLPPGTVEAVIHDTLHEVPEDGSTQWTTRSMAKRFGVGKDSVARIWRDHELEPWRVGFFKISNDPHFEERLVDVVGVYLDPPERAVVFSFDEKTQRQALDRTQPSLPVRPGRGGTLTPDHKRNGTTDLLAALNVGTGEVIYDCKGRHTARDVLSFLKLIDLHVPRELDIHVVLDNLSAHKAPEIRTWLAHPKRARWHLHFTPTSSSWLNLVEGWFELLTERRLRHGVLSSVEALREAIELWAEHWNDDPKPFVWRKTAEEIIERVRRGRAALHQVHATPHH